MFSLLPTSPQRGEAPDSRPQRVRVGEEAEVPQNSQPIQAPNSFYPAANTASTLMLKPARSRDVACAPRRKTPCST